MPGSRARVNRGSVILFRGSADPVQRSQQARWSIGKGARVHGVICRWSMNLKSSDGLAELGSAAGSGRGVSARGLASLGEHSLEASLLLTAYNLLVVERSDQILLGRGPFLQRAVLLSWEKAAFCMGALLETMVMVASLSLLLSYCFRRFRRIPAWAPTAVVSAGYAMVVTAQYRVLQYFKDGIDLEIIRNLGGGQLSSSLHYVRTEVGAILPLLIGVAIGVPIGIYFLHRFVIRGALLQGAASRWCSPRRVIAGNLAVLGLVVTCAVTDPDLNLVLQYVPAHYVYAAMANRLTDFDGDGWGLLSTPRDFAPFDATRHPYAVEVPGNGVDEDGVAGDLPVAAVDEYRQREKGLADWDAAKMAPRNVVLVVLETARADLLAADSDGTPVMPVLRGLPGHRLPMFSNSGYTATSLIAMMTGALCDEDRPSLVQRFRMLGYQTGVFSGQNESFGKTDERSHFDQADILVDARSFAKNQRMYTSTAAGAIAIPTSEVNAVFQKWCGARDRSRPFFAYLNWQEMHFPYYHENGPRPLLQNPIPREEIVPKNSDWLRRTYQNAARGVDHSVAELVRILRDQGAFDQTVILVLGDHGEELFENGRLGHGTNVSVEQNAALCKLIHSPWQPPAAPMGSVDVTTILYNSLVRSQADALPLPGSVLCYTGNVRQPREIGMITSNGLLKYDFRQNRWFSQAKAGQAPRLATGDNRVVWAWESLMVLQQAVKNDSRH